MEETETLARAAGLTGEVVLRRRGGPGATYELIVNGVFAMDSVETSSEQGLGELPHVRAGTEVLVGGLGLGYTAAAVLSRGVRRVDVAEIEPAVVAWAREGRTPTLAAVARDPRVTLLVGDVAAVLTDDRHGPWDAIVLDVDNGPDFLVHEPNATLYADPGLRLAYGRLRPSGTLAIWCQGPAPALEAALRRISPDVAEHSYPVLRGKRSWSYVVYTAGRPE